MIFRGPHNDLCGLDHRGGTRAISRPWCQLSLSCLGTCATIGEEAWGLNISHEQTSFNSLAHLALFFFGLKIGNLYVCLVLSRPWDLRRECLIGKCMGGPA